VADVENLGGWMTTVVARVCLDMLRSRRSRREEALADQALEPVAAGQDVIDPEQEAVLGDSIGLALLVVLEKLAPAERVAFVLHDSFGVPFEEIALVVGRTADATRVSGWLSTAGRRLRRRWAPAEEEERQRDEAALAQAQRREAPQSPPGCAPPSSPPSSGARPGMDARPGPRLGRRRLPALHGLPPGAGLRPHRAGAGAAQRRRGHGLTPARRGGAELAPPLPSHSIATSAPLPGAEGAAMNLDDDAGRASPELDPIG
jgi:DNA-directed RNA polymerase specialized sigma24 family protein